MPHSSYFLAWINVEALPKDCIISYTEEYIEEYFTKKWTSLALLRLSLGTLGVPSLMDYSALGIPSLPDSRRVYFHGAIDCYLEDMYLDRGIENIIECFSSHIH